MLLDSWSKLEYLEKYSEKLEYLEKYRDKNNVCFDATFVGQSL